MEFLARDIDLLVSCAFGEGIAYASHSPRKLPCTSVRFTPAIHYSNDRVAVRPNDRGELGHRSAVVIAVHCGLIRLTQD